MLLFLIDLDLEVGAAVDHGVRRELGHHERGLFGREVGLVQQRDHEVPGVAHFHRFGPEDLGHGEHRSSGRGWLSELYPS